MIRTIYLLVILQVLVFTSAKAQRLSSIEQIPIESYKEMKEIERYQLKVAEKYYLKKEYKIAMAEYEKYLSLYEESAGAPHAQLMWSQCLVKLRKVNTAIREGFQSVVDYWPDSEEAKSAAYLIARSYQSMGEMEKAKAAFRGVMEEYPDGNLAILSRSNLLEMAKIAKDEETVLQLLEELTYKIKRNDVSRNACVNASRELTRYYTHRGNWTEAKRALETSYQGSQFDHYLYHYGTEGIRHLLGKQDTKAMAISMGSELIAKFEESIPTILDSDGKRSQARESLNRIAGVYGNLREPKKVIATYERIEKMLGISDGLLGQMAGFYKSINERNKAREMYQRYENQVAGKNAIASMFREEGKFDEAIEMYRELTQEDAKGINTYLWAIAECYEGKREWKNAIQSYRQCDNFPSNYLRIASCHRRLKQWTEALGMYNQVKSSDNHAPEATYLMGHTYEEAGQRENAIKSFQLTCRNYPKSGYASRAHAHLQTKYKITATFGGAKDE